MFAINESFGKLKIGKGKSYKDIKYVHHIIKHTEKIREHAKYRRWLKIHGMPYVDNSNIIYNKKEKRWMKK